MRLIVGLVAAGIGTAIVLWVVWATLVAGGVIGS